MPGATSCPIKKPGKSNYKINALNLFVSGVSRNLYFLVHLLLNTYVGYEQALNKKVALYNTIVTSPISKLKALHSAH